MKSFLLFITVFLPLLTGSFSLSLHFCKINKIIRVLAPTVGITISAISALWIFMNIAQGDILLPLCTSFSGLNLEWALFCDPLTSVMLLVITSVAAVVHIYSIGYMHDDKEIERFMGLLSIFAFFMMMLVTSQNCVQLFLGWEGVGLASYLLIGFWFHKESANNAAIKAFVVNRVGDVGLALGFAYIYKITGTLNFQEIFAHLDNPEFISNINIICTLLVMGLMGKSAQIGLHVWLPDAMEGPTPVSALIHAATMVTAGVFMVIRFNPLFEAAPLVKDGLVVLGLVTSFIAACMAMVNNDIKRTIAYSTCSQLGYMVMACGLGGYGAALFHLFTHAYFKALLFLGAGSVIHAFDGEQDMRKMGGVYKDIPYTYALMLIGSLALAGLMYTSGFYSKESIIILALTKKYKWAFIGASLVAFMTAIYSMRSVMMVFHGKKKESHVHESPAVMLVPLLLLAFGALCFGYMFEHMFLEPHGLIGQMFGELKLDHHNKLTMVPALLSIAGILLGILYFKIPGSFKFMNNKLIGKLKNLALNKFYFDEIYHALFVKTFIKLANICWKKGDIGFIENTGIKGLLMAVEGGSEKVMSFQSNKINHYLKIMMVFISIIFGLILV